MSTPAIRILKQQKIPHTLHTFDGGTDDFGKVAAAALGVPSEQIFKTLVVDVSTGPKRQLAVCCVPVSTKLHLKKAAAALQVPKLRMAEAQDVQRSTGYVLGGVSPIGQKHPLPTIIDSSAQQFDTIYVSGGKRGLDIELAPNDLVALLQASYHPITHDPL